MLKCGTNFTSYRVLQTVPNAEMLKMGPTAEQNVQNRSIPPLKITHVNHVTPVAPLAARDPAKTLATKAAILVNK